MILLALQGGGGPGRIVAGQDPLEQLGRGGRTWVASSFMPHLGQRPGSALDTGMHRTGISDLPGVWRHSSWVVHLRDQCQDLGRIRGQPGLQLGTLGL